MSLEALIRACAEDDDAAAWEEFVGRFHELIASVVLRTARRWGCSSPASIDDLIQETYLKVCRDRRNLLGQFTPHHPEAFYGFLKVVTANVVHDHFRGLRSQKRGLGRPQDSIDSPGVNPPSAAAATTQRIQRDILLKEVDRTLCAQHLGDDLKRDRAIFWLYYRYGLTAPAIARLPSISLTVKGVESVIHRLTRLVREQLTEPSDSS